MTVKPKAPGPGKFATPDITPAQIAAGITAIAAQAVAWGWIKDTTGQNLVAVAGIILPTAWAFADAHIRHGRATGTADK